MFSYTIGGLKASEKENSVLCLYRIGKAAPRPEIRERAKVRENILQWSQGHCRAQRRERLPVWNCRGRKTHSYNDRSCRGKIAFLSTVFLYRYRYKFFIFFPTQNERRYVMSCSFVRLGVPLGCFSARRSFLFSWRRNSRPSIFSGVYSKPF